MIYVLFDPRFNYCFFLTLVRGGCRISQEYSSLFVIVINLILCFRYDALTELSEPIFFMYFCIQSSIGTKGLRVKLVDCKML